MEQTVGGDDSFTKNLFADPSFLGVWHSDIQITSTRNIAESVKRTLLENEVVLIINYDMFSKTKVQNPYSQYRMSFVDRDIESLGMIPDHDDRLCVIMVYLDPVLSGVAGTENLETLKIAHPEKCHVIRYGKQEQLHTTVKDEAKEIIMKFVTKIAEQRSNSAQNSYDPKIIGRSETIKKEIKKVETIAKYDSSVLIIGESGTGKELFAKKIHEMSNRSKGPFKTINCGAISENLIESELFGHEKGAFTGAITQRAGVFEEANTGTLFLDEIGELPYPMQAKLLRAVEYKIFSRVGSNKDIAIDVRIVAATNKDMKSAIRRKEFREDLYFRLAQQTIKLPNLNERGSDIRLLAQFFLDRHNDKYKTAKVFGRGAVTLFETIEWPGNIRQLSNVVEALAVYSLSGEISRAQVEEALKMELGIEHGITVGSLSSLDEIEKEHIISVFKKMNSNLMRTAKVLNIDPKTLRRKLKECGSNVDT